MTTIAQYRGDIMIKLVSHGARNPRTWQFLRPYHNAAILWNAVTSLGENNAISDPLPDTSFCETQWRHSVKTRLYKTPPPYFIVLASSVKKKIKVIEFHEITEEILKAL